MEIRLYLEHSSCQLFEEINGVLSWRSGRGSNPMFLRSCGPTVSNPFLPAGDFTSSSINLTIAEIHVAKEGRKRAALSANRVNGC